MAVSQIVTCDCCNHVMEDSSVLHCLILTYMDRNTGSVVQKYYGVTCGCDEQMLTAIANTAAAEMATPHMATPAQATP